MNVLLIIPLKEINYNGGKDYIKTTAVKEMCKVSFDLDGGAFNKDRDEEETGIAERFFEKNGEISFDEIPEKEGFSFKYWEEVIPENENLIAVGEEKKDEQQKEEPPRYKKGDSYIVTKDVTFKAIWEKDA